MHRTRSLLSMAGLALLLAGCGGLPSASSDKSGKVYQRESFSAEETFSRLFDANVDATCEAARRALLSQGYVISKADSGVVRGTKNFQPEGEVHVEIAFNVVCVGDGPKQQIATAYVSAQQDRYALKKNPQAASLGVSALGSISVPLSSTQDSLVKVASETIPAGEFYDRFFTLMQRMLRENTSNER
ncbi:DUF2242 domain-containing protein [Pelomonas cellulosilytica]|uniref:DUF2242 domain-containing protein n=1 Tax=Pelomonas cellulosilytica TaxID=2906762 RepID=A0ABS8XXN3_9BURK|nr:DUF2242 domain-containing protein [Pelomonas sp. P8]MCE4555612.1 DUF2242 domain-containing protein [Pelomonas sp. P8]